jgi:hypothetical protein
MAADRQRWIIVASRRAVGAEEWGQMKRKFGQAGALLWSEREYEGEGEGEGEGENRNTRRRRCKGDCGIH